LFAQQNSKLNMGWCSINPDTLTLIGDAVRPGNYVQHSVFRRVANYVNESHLVSLVDDSTGAGPANIVLKSYPTVWPKHLAIRENTISFNNVTVDLKEIPVFVSAMKIPPVSNPDEPLLLPQIKKYLINIAPAKSLVFLLSPERCLDFKQSFDRNYMLKMSQAVHTWQTGAFLMAVTMMKGCGFGLTPGGDDFIAGLLTGLHLIQKNDQLNLDKLIRKVLLTAQGGNRLSNAFLEFAAEGRLTARQQELVYAMYIGQCESLENTVGKVVAIGETSGADWLTGLIFILEKGVGSCQLSAE